MDNLPPCPFCGGDARVIRSSGYRRVMCWSCNAQTGYAETEAEVVHAWNTRTPAPSSLPDVWRRFCEIIDKTDDEGFTPEIEQELMDLRALATDGSEDER